MAGIRVDAEFEGEEFGKALQQVVTATQLGHGHIFVTLHEGSIVKVELRPVLVVPFDRGGKPLLAEEDTGFNLRATDRFMARPFSDVLRDRIGGFGALEVFVHDGHVVEWSFRQRQRPQRAKRALAGAAND
jgi:hypothetical protein